MKMRPRANFNRETKKKILHLHDKGHSLSKISEQLELRMVHVMDVLDEKNLKPNLSEFED
tara:strand:+ start:2438 stop:2617 length:180 start_codon:yes stop_codon:yes gene_type:complete